MCNEPIVVLLHKNDREAGWLWRELAIFVAHESLKPTASWSWG